MQFFSFTPPIRKAMCTKRPCRLWSTPSHPPLHTTLRCGQPLPPPTATNVRGCCGALRGKECAVLNAASSVTISVRICSMLIVCRVRTRTLLTVHKPHIPPSGFRCSVSSTQTILAPSLHPSAQLTCHYSCPPSTLTLSSLLFLIYLLSNVLSYSCLPFLLYPQPLHPFCLFNSAPLTLAYWTVVQTLEFFHVMLNLIFTRA